MTVGIRHSGHVARSMRKTLALTSPTSGSRSIGIACSQTQVMDFVYLEARTEVVLWADHLSRKHENPHIVKLHVLLVVVDFPSHDHFIPGVC
jgi:hypothetical protein